MLLVLPLKWLIQPLSIPFCSKYSWKHNHFIWTRSAISYLGHGPPFLIPIEQILQATAKVLILKQKSDHDTPLNTKQARVYHGQISATPPKVFYRNESKSKIPYCNTQRPLWSFTGLPSYLPYFSTALSHAC